MRRSGQCGETPEQVAAGIDPGLVDHEGRVPHSELAELVADAGVDPAEIGLTEVSTPGS